MAPVKSFNIYFKGSVILFKCSRCWWKGDIRDNIHTGDRNIALRCTLPKLTKHCLLSLSTSSGLLVDVEKPTLKITNKVRQISQLLQDVPSLWIASILLIPLCCLSYKEMLSLAWCSSFFQTFSSVLQIRAVTSLWINVKPLTAWSN